MRDLLYCTCRLRVALDRICCISCTITLHLCYSPIQISLITSGYQFSHLPKVRLGFLFKNISNQRQKGFRGDSLRLTIDLLKSAFDPILCRSRTPLRNQSHPLMSELNYSFRWLHVFIFYNVIRRLGVFSFHIGKIGTVKVFIRYDGLRGLAFRFNKVFKFSRETHWPSKKLRERMRQCP